MKPKNLLFIMSDEHNPKMLGCAGNDIVVGGVLAVIVYLTYRFAEPIGRFLGETALNIIIRLSSFILLCIGVQIMWNGVSALLATVVR